MGNRCVCLQTQDAITGPRLTEVLAGRESSPINPSILASEGLSRSEGVTVVLEGGLQYTGQWKGDIREGVGILLRPDGNRYEGQFQNDMAHGNGRLETASGDVYDGEWLQDKAHGFGRLIQKSGRIRGTVGG